MAFADKPAHADLKREGDRLSLVGKKRGPISSKIVFFSYYNV